MAVKVKIRRLRLLARLEEVLAEENKKVERAMAKWERDMSAARKRLAVDLEAKIPSIHQIPIENQEVRVPTGPRGSRYVKGIAIACDIKIPQKPERPHALREIERGIRLLDMSEEEFITVSESDQRVYGIASIEGL